MDFESARKQFERLSRLFHRGEINTDEFTKGVDKLSVTDAEGQEWMIGMRSGKWYRKDRMDWVEDDPLGMEGEDDPGQAGRRAGWRKWILVVAVLLLAALCIGTWNFGVPGLIPKRYDLGLLAGSGTQETEPVSQTVMATNTVETSADTPESTADTSETTPSPTSSGVQPSEPDQTATLTPQPTVTMTPTPPPPIASPETWQLRSALNLEEQSPLNQDWAKIPDKPWEYEFLIYENIDALLIQFMDPDVLWHAEGEEVEDVERTLNLAIPDIEGAVSILCRWQIEDDSGYKVRLTNFIWQFVQVANGVETVLVQGDQSPDFDIGNYATFVLRCRDDRIEFWRDGEELVDFEGAEYETGASGLHFEIDEGIGLAFITSDQVWTQAPEDEIAVEGDLVRVGDLDIWLAAVNDVYGNMVENKYEGQELIGFELRIANKGLEPIEITPQNFILNGINRQVGALDFVPQTAVGSQLFPFGDVTGNASGEVFFAGVSPAGLANWTLVVDLRYQGYGEIFFELGGE